MGQVQGQAIGIASKSDDAELVRRALARDGSAFRAVMQTHNRKLYRIARSIVRNDSEAEDVVQEAYVRVFSHLESFRGDSTLATWLARIVMNEALGRLRKQRPTVDLETIEAHRPEPKSFSFLAVATPTTRNERWRNGRSYGLLSRRLTLFLRFTGLFLSRG